MCQGDSVSGTREVKLLFSIFCSTSTFIWNYLLSLLSAAATGSNVQMFNETTNNSTVFQKICFIDTHWRSVANLFLYQLAGQKLEKLAPISEFLSFCHYFYIFSNYILGRHFIFAVESRSPVFCATATHFIYICGGKDSAALHLCPRER